MSQSREEYKATYDPLIAAFVSTLGGQPFRVLLSKAGNDFKPQTTVMNAWTQDRWRMLIKGLPVNLLRGTLSTAASAYAKNHTGELAADFHPWLKSSAMLGAAAFADMGVAYLCETWFIRNSNLDRNGMYKGVKFSRFNFAPALLPLYFIRGAGFGGIVFFSKGLPFYQENLILVSGTVFTATSQKFISAVATNDIMRDRGTVPDFKSGILRTLSDVGKGDVYTHPSYQGYFKNANTTTKKLANIAYVGCSPSMFIWRGSYMYTVKYLFNFTEKNAESIKHKIGLFAQRFGESVKRMEPHLFTAEEHDIMRSCKRNT